MCYTAYQIWQKLTLQPTTREKWTPTLQTLDKDLKQIESELCQNIDSLVNDSVSYKSLLKISCNPLKQKRTEWSRAVKELSTVICVTKCCYLLQRTDMKQQMSGEKRLVIIITVYLKLPWLTLHCFTLPCLNLHQRALPYFNLVSFYLTLVYLNFG